MLSRDQTESRESKIAFDPKDQGIVKQKLDVREVKISGLFVHPIKVTTCVATLRQILTLKHRAAVESLSVHHATHSWASR